MSAKLKWVRPSKDNLPPINSEILVRYKHGLISGFFDYQRYLDNGDFVFNAYVWQSVEGYIYEFISMDAFNSVFEKETSDVK